MVEGGHWRQLCDYDLEFLEDLADLLDRRLEQADQEIAKASGHMDTGLILDRLEYVTAIGLIACQVYMAEVIGKTDRTRREACLSLGPKHTVGYSMAAIINAGANYAKHGPEEALAKNTRAILDACSVLRPDEEPAFYPMIALLDVLVKPHPRRFRKLLPFLERWRDEVLAAGT
jgi:hypothetical protein